jgi:hypothetical protein
MKALTLILLTLIGVTIGSVIGGYVLSVLWGWFIVTTFSLPALGIVEAIGLNLIVGFLTYQYTAEKQDAEDEKYAIALTNSIVKSIIFPLIILFIGYIVHHFL